MLRNTRLPHDASLTTPAPLLRHPWLPLVLGSAGILSTVSLGMLLVVAGRGPTALDGLWHDLMLDWRTEPWVAVATWFDSAGGVGAMVVVGLFLTVSLLIMRRPWSALALATAMICAEAATATIKVLVARPRPTDSLADTGLTSFPSRTHHHRSNDCGHAHIPDRSTFLAGRGDLDHDGRLEPNIPRGALADGRGRWSRARDVDRCRRLVGGAPSSVFDAGSAEVRCNLMVTPGEVAAVRFNRMRSWRHRLLPLPARRWEGHPDEAPAGGRAASD